MSFERVNVLTTTFAKWASHVDLQKNLQQKYACWFLFTGRYYVKLGFDGAVQGVLTSSADVKRWFEKGDSDIEQSVAKFTVSLFRGIFNVLTLVFL